MMELGCLATEGDLHPGSAEKFLLARVVVHGTLDAGAVTDRHFHEDTRNVFRCLPLIVQHGTADRDVFAQIQRQLVPDEELLAIGDVGLVDHVAKRPADPKTVGQRRLRFGTEHGTDPGRVVEEAASDVLLDDPGLVEQVVAVDLRVVGADEGRLLAGAQFQGPAEAGGQDALAGSYVEAPKLEVLGRSQGCGQAQDQQCDREKPLRHSAFPFDELPLSFP